MAYEKYTWQTGEVITQEKLNHMEQGIEDAYELPAVTETDNGKVLGVENGQFGLVNGGDSDVLTIVNAIVQNNSGVFTVQYIDKTFEEIAAAVENGEYVVARVRIDTSGAPYSGLLFLQPPQQASFPTDGSSDMMIFSAVLLRDYYEDTIHLECAILQIPRTGTPTFERYFQ